MKKEDETDKLDIIANLLALQVIREKTLVDSVWVLTNAGMKNSEIARILEISNKSVSAHVSNKRKQLERLAKEKTK